ncbi:MAG TPA: hypothetical protein VMF30_01595 [Pirellulales bacterium]|nr:hypothetical protein [Pirellulales bacterium]
MRRMFLRLLALVAALGAGLLCAEAADLNNAASQAACQQCEIRNGCTWCPNDYCRKPKPGAPATPCEWAPNDYCRKPKPGAPPTPCQWAPNDYCRKPATPLPKNCEPWYRCVAQ